MGTFHRELEFGDADGKQFIEVNALVDTGVTHSSLPEDSLARLGVQPSEEHPFILANGQQISHELAWIRVRLDGREQPTPVIFGERGREALLGAVTLGEFGLGVDPINRRLVPMPGYLVGLIDRDSR